MIEGPVLQMRKGRLSSVICPDLKPKHPIPSRGKRELAEPEIMG